MAGLGFTLALRDDRWEGARVIAMFAILATAASAWAVFAARAAEAIIRRIDDDRPGDTAG